MVLDVWARKHNVCRTALEELRGLLCVETYRDPTVKSVRSEAAVLNDVRLEASKKGARLWRNNVGAATTDTGSFIRYGLANESSAQNKIIKSADLIGIRPVLITFDMVGCTIGQFLSREIKQSNWKSTKDNPRICAQKAWAALIISLGGDAKFATGTGTI